MWAGVPSPVPTLTTTIDMADASTGFTYSYWMKEEINTDTKTILTVGTDDIKFYTNPTSNIYKIGSTTLTHDRQSANEWHHYGIVYDGTNSTITVDGSNLDTDSTALSLSGTSNIVIGIDSDVAGATMVADFRYYINANSNLLPYLSIGKSVADSVSVADNNAYDIRWGEPDNMKGYLSLSSSQFKNNIYDKSNKDLTISYTLGMHTDMGSKSYPVMSYAGTFTPATSSMTIEGITYDFPKINKSPFSSMTTQQLGIVHQYTSNLPTATPDTLLVSSYRGGLMYENEFEISGTVNTSNMNDYSVTIDEHGQSSAKLDGTALTGRSDPSLIAWQQFELEPQNDLEIKNHSANPLYTGLKVVNKNYNVHPSITDN